MEKKQITTNNRYRVDDDIQKLRALGISILKIVNKVTKCQKLKKIGSTLDISKMTELSEPCVFMEREKILGIYVDKFFPKQKIQEYYNLLEFTYNHARYVE